MNWSEEKISSFAEVTTGGTPSTDKREFWDGGTIPWLNSGDLNQGLVTKASKFITEEGYKSSSTKLMPPNTVLIALTGATTGLAALLKIEACANQSVTGIFPSEKHYPEFLYYFFKTQRQRILDAAWGGAQPHINQRYVKDYVVPLPPLADQIKIATVLSKAEALIKQRKENIELLDEFLKSTFLKMFGDPVSNEKSWDEKTIENYFEIEDGDRGKNYPGQGALVDKGILFLNTSNFKENKLYLEKANFIAEERFNKLTKGKLKANDLIITLRGSVGNVVIFQGDKYSTGFINAQMAIMRPLTANVIFTHRLLISDSLQRVLKNVSSGSAQPQLPITQLKKIKLINPPFELQNQFAAIVLKAESLKEQLKSSLIDLENLYGSLSQRAFKGELDLSKLAIDENLLPKFIESDNQVEKYNPAILKALDAENAISKHFEKTNELSKAVNRFNIYFEQWEKLTAPLYRLPKIPNELIEAQQRIEKIQAAFAYVKPFKPKKSEKVLWEKVSTQQVANWIKEKYTGYHFTSEMLIRFLTDEHVIFPDYYSSEELKKNPKANDADDLKTLIFSSLNNENPFLKLEQVFYNPELDNVNLTLKDEDFELIKNRTRQERTGVYLRIAK